MKVGIVNCFDTYEDRVDLLYSFFCKEGNDVTVIQSDFRHIKKIKRTEKKENFIFIESRPYYKNLSVDRLKSHYDFSKDAFKVVQTLKPDLLYVMMPPNSLGKFSRIYKKKNKDIKLIFDLIDLWPETMPIGRIKKFPPFSFWKKLRDRNLKAADIVICECDLYKEVLKNQLKNIKCETIYLAQNKSVIPKVPTLSSEKINLCYLGSINNIIDIPKVKSIISEINKIKPVVFHIIGDGEKREELIQEINDIGCKVEYYGKIYNSHKKQQIFDKCHFGLNIMKDSVCVGLTMKSIDYFQAGLPIINNIKSDTMRLVDDRNIGINFDENNKEGLFNRISKMKNKDFINMRINTLKVFDDFFSINAFEEKLSEILKEI